MCCGSPPFRAESSFGVMKKISDEVAGSVRKLNPGMPEWLDFIIEKLMAKEKNERFVSAAQVREILEACLSHVQQPQVFKLPSQISGSKQSVLTRCLQSSIRIRAIGVFTMLSLLIASVMWGFLQNSNPESVTPFDETKAEVLGHGYSRQGDFIYFNKQRIDEAGKEDFRRFARSANLKLRQCQDVDAASFKH